MTQPPNSTLLFSDDERKTAFLKFGDSFDVKKEDSSPSSVCYVMEFLLKLYRRHCSKAVLCDSVLHLKDQLVALQLIMAQHNKKVFKDNFSLKCPEMVDKMGKAQFQ